MSIGTTKQGIAVALKYIGEAGYSGIDAPGKSEYAAFREFFITLLPGDSTKTVYRELRRQALIDVTISQPMRYCIALSPAGAHRLLKLTTDELVIPTTNTWDGRWRLLCFDIPKGKDKERLYLNRRLHELGFTMIQRSMWVHPYDCYDVIRQITDYCNLTRYVSVLEVVKLDSLTSRNLYRVYGLGA